MKRILECLVVLFCLGCVAYAQQKPKLQPWIAEPSSFLGITFGVPLSASVPPCPFHMDYGIKVDDWPDFGRPCSEPVATFQQIYNVKGFFNVFIQDVGGRVGDVMASFKDSAGDGVSAALEEKFGPPQERRKEIVTSRAGVEYPDIILRWIGPHVVIEFDSVGGKVDEGVVEASTTAFIAQSKSDERKKTEQYKNQF